MGTLRSDSNGTPYDVTWTPGGYFVPQVAEHPTGTTSRSDGGAAPSTYSVTQGKIVKVQVGGN